MRTFVSTIVTAAVVAVAACHDSTSPAALGQHAPLSILAGSGVTDTVYARLAQALIVEVRDAAGRPISHVVVRFTAIPGTSPYYYPPALLASLTSNNFGTFVADSTDDRGQAAALVQLGATAGPAKILIEVPELALQDTARYTVLPGAAANIAISVRDTTVTPGAQYSLSAAAADRFGNKRPNDKITFTARSPVVTVDAAGNVTAVQEGRSSILVQTGNATDSAQVSVVPLHGLVVWNGGSLFTVNTDGTQLKPLTTSPDRSLFPQWSPDGARVMIYEADPSYNARISFVDMSGARTLFIGPSATMSSASYGRFTRDGSWIYFTGIAPGDNSWVTYRIKPDGTQLEQMGPTGPEGGSLRPDVSPDGKTETFQFNNGTLGLMDIATHTIKPLGFNGLFPRFSPDGTQIAYLAGSQTGVIQVYVMKADGTGSRAISPSSVNYQDLSGVDWSSDGKWILSASYPEVDLLRVSDGLRLPLRVNGLQAAWKP